MKTDFSADTDRVRSLRLDGRGRVTIPKDLRQSLGLSEGDRVEIVVSPDE